MLLICSTDYLLTIDTTALLLPAAEPNNRKLTTTGPKIVPKLLTPPARFKRVEPVSGEPKATQKGLTAVCCKANPIAMIKNEPRIRPNTPALTAGTINNAPTAEITRPKTMAFL